MTPATLTVAWLNCISELSFLKAVRFDPLHRSGPKSESQNSHDVATVQIGGCYNSRVEWNGQQHTEQVTSQTTDDPRLVSANANAGARAAAPHHRGWCSAPAGLQCTPRLDPAIGIDPIMLDKSDCGVAPLGTAAGDVP